MLKNLIGSQILKIEENKIKLQKDGKEFHLNISSYDGDCCGYADFELKMLYSENDLCNPIITDVKLIENDSFYSSKAEIVFYGESKEIAQINANAGSGSGFSYGACVSLVCTQLDIDETLAQW